MIEFIWKVLWPMALYELSTEGCHKIFAASQGLMVQTVSAMIMIGILGVIYRKKTPVSPKNRNTAWFMTIIVLVVAGACGCLLCNNLITFSGLKHKFTGYRHTIEVLFSPPLWIQMVSMGAIIPMAEELIFRGFIYTAFRERYSFWVAGFFSSVIFGAYHGNFVQGLYAMALALILAYSYEQYHSIFAPWIVHGIANLTSLLAGRWIGYGENMAGVSFLLITGFSGLGVIFAINRMKHENQKEVLR